MNAVANFFSRLVNRYLPDPLVIAVILTFFTLLLAMAVEGTSFLAATQHWGDGFWDLLEFTMQMAIILLAGYMLAKTPLVDRALDIMISPVSNPRTAIIVATLVGGIGTWLNWGFGLVIGGIVAQKLALHVRGLHYPLAIASAYSGFALYGVGLSGSVPLVIATKGHFLEDQIGIVGLGETIFSPVILTTVALVIVLLPLFNALLHPKRDAEVTEIDPGTVPAAPTEPEAGAERERTFSSWLNDSPVIGIAIGALGMLWVVLHFSNGGSLELNTVNFLFVFLGLLLFARPSRYLATLQDGVRTIAGIVIQYPFYAGIMAILVGSGLMVTIAEGFASAASAESLPLWSFVSGGLINILAPSGGGQWAVQGPVMMETARTLGADVAATAVAVQVGDQWTNMIQPFWILPVLAISKLHLRDVMGYLVLVLVFLGVLFGGAMLTWGYLAA
ncbi:short-chain fatty acids transporter [Lipingzhangella halophila]|uniref:Short-chain fatty acids transporter n=1 Tax=Lipingzhangella halophila TaxID=1783352 RepID=A0A7W7RPH9_9ACTN|nr:TIGR00366 family protein [Lipingzhangella halophila]MBB4935258.1 short-chain fatty acids transporter [Lipingzhangella halophila]